jgi:SAM-dependent methyltransferase
MNASNQPPSPAGATPQKQSSSSGSADEYSRIRWIHAIDLGNGTVTPGIWQPHYEEYGLDRVDFKGKSVLDIGCIDGLYTFYAEKRGASRILSFDIADEQFGPQHGDNRDWTAGYKYAHKVLKSKAEYRFPFSVYNLDPEAVGTFDIALFLGVLYHLAHPALALERINSILKMGGTMVLEAEVSAGRTGFFRQFKHNPTRVKAVPIKVVSMRSAIARLRARVRLLKRLISPTDTGDVYRGDVTNFWVLSPEVMERHIDYAGFRIEHARQFDARRSYICTKVAEPDPMFAAGRPRVAKPI